MRVAIIGSREIGADNSIYEKIKTSLPSSCSEIVSGGAKGVDMAAQRLADELQLRFTCFLPKYELYGITAPLKRNEEIIAYADLVIAFWDFDSKGTQNSIASAIKAGKPVKIIEL
ncbi:MAG TPA: hypothetical protein DEQ02_00285 [Ruminococcaceae bacterium]|nr:hypothetical protein [Oscillospiraceae bacterium]